MCGKGAIVTRRDEGVSFAAPPFRIGLSLRNHHASVVNAFARVGGASSASQSPFRSAPLNMGARTPPSESWTVIERGV